MVEAFKLAWDAYEKYAWGHDEYHPLSKTHSEWFGVGLTIIDSLDTLIIMGLRKGMCFMGLRTYKSMWLFRGFQFWQFSWDAQENLVASKLILHRRLIALNVNHIVTFP